MNATNDYGLDVDGNPMPAQRNPEAAIKACEREAEKAERNGDTETANLKRGEAKQLRARYFRDNTERPMDAGQGPESSPMGHACEDDESYGGEPEEVSAKEAETSNQCVTASCYYEAGRREYLIKNSRGRWLPLSESQFKRILRKRGLSPKVPEGRGVSPVEDEVLRIQDEHDIHFAGQLAGYPEGFYEQNGTRFLVTESPQLIETSAGEWSTLKAVLTGMLGSGDQFSVFMGWMKFASKMLHTRNRQPGQALVFAGPAGCGKSLTQGLITEMLGGRSAKAALFLTGRTDFNAELFGAEHLILEDEFMSTKISDRQRLGAGIKGLSVNEFHPCHRKGQTIVNMRPLWRVSISVNDDPEALLVLPPMDNHLRDKFILLRCENAKLPMPTETAEEQKQFREALSAELPAFLHHLLEFKLPENLRCSRYGVVSFHDPRLAQDLETLSPEAQLLELIDTAGKNLFACGENWTGTAAELKNELLRFTSTQREATTLLNWRNATGTYLGRIVQKHPKRVSSTRTAEARTWVIHPMTP